MTTTGKTLILLTLCLLMAACAPVETDPSAIAAAAESRIRAEAARATADSAEYQARANEMALTATAEAPSLQMTATMAALEAQATGQALAATQQSYDATATAQYFTPTPSLTPTPNITATLDAANAEAQKRIIEKQASDYMVKSELELKRQVAINDFIAKLPVLVFMLIVAILGILIFGMVRSKRFQAAPINERGEMLDNQTGSIVIAGRNPNYRGYATESISRDFVVALAGVILQFLKAAPVQPPVTAERQDRTTTGEQTVELARVIRTPRGLDTAIKNASPSPLLSENINANRFDVVDGERAPVELGPDLMAILNAQWENL